MSVLRFFLPFSLSCSGRMTIICKEKLLERRIYLVFSCVGDFGPGRKLS
jgi:hypothetical protein